MSASLSTFKVARTNSCKTRASMSYASGTLRITHDIKDVQTGGDLSIAVAYKDSDIRHVRALILGPADTPYEFGLFEFNVRFGKDYPTSPLTIHAITTNQGRTRFNPNIYADGKVCLSILGTWRGEQGEQWSSAQGLGSVLWSIQSLMSANPYENEPGFESRNQKDKDKPQAIEYRNKIHHETLRISVIIRLERYLGISVPEDIADKKKKELVFGANEEDEDPLEAWEPFTDMCKRRFLWYYDSYKESIDAVKFVNGDSVKDGRKFIAAPFEAGNNIMQGCFNYTTLEKRLDRIQAVLEDEVASWELAGREAAVRESPIALSFSNSFRKVQAKFRDTDIPMELQLEDKNNPFVWSLTLFGRGMTNLEGAVLNIKLVFPKDFPDSWPRVICQTPLFHHRISKQGTICYVPDQSDDIESHIQAIINVIEEESPRHDPRMRVNPEASRLLWGTPEDQKMYGRKLRRSAQESAENC